VKQNSEIELAYDILRQAGQAMYFRDLISKVLDNSQQRVYSVAHAMAEIHTQINMDSRFMHMGKGMWGLVDWNPQTGHKIAADEAAAASDTSAKRRNRLLEEIQQDDVEASGSDHEMS
jgi:DNA-directed RNA polymerase subunit delta